MTKHDTVRHLRDFLTDILNDIIGSNKRSGRLRQSLKRLCFFENVLRFLIEISIISVDFLLFYDIIVINDRQRSCISKQITQSCLKYKECYRRSSSADHITEEAEWT